MKLYRMIYLRVGKVRGTTFAAASASKAANLAWTWIESGKNPIGKLLTVVPLNNKQPLLKGLVE